jgi:hypothetical protein
MAAPLVPSSMKTSSITMFRGSSIMSLVRYGMKVDACACGFRACALMFENLKAP